MALVAGLILGFVNPHAHYAYRVIKHTVAQASLSAAVLEGTFIEAEGLTFFAEGAAIGPGGLELDRVFVYEQGEDGETIVVTGRNGLLAQGAKERRPVLVLEKGCAPRSRPTAAPPRPFFHRSELADRHRKRSFPCARPRSEGAHADRAVACP